MSNYNERLDEILSNSFYKLDKHIIDEHPDPDMTEPCKYGDDLRDEAKQAITSLMKELVAEAKPQEYVLYYATDPLEWGRQRGYDEALREFEQNLLKALSKETSQET